MLVVMLAWQVKKRISLSDSKQQSIVAIAKNPSTDDIPALCPGPMKATEEYYCQVQHQRRYLRKRKQHRQFIIMMMIIIIILIVIIIKTIIIIIIIIERPTVERGDRKKLWEMKNVTAVPEVIGALWVVSKGFKICAQKVGVKIKLEVIQKTTLLGTECIITKYLSFIDETTGPLVTGRYQRIVILSREVKPSFVNINNNLVRFTLPCS